MPGYSYVQMNGEKFVFLSSLAFCSICTFPVSGGKSLRWFVKKTLFHPPDSRSSKVGSSQLAWKFTIFEFLPRNKRKEKSAWMKPTVHSSCSLEFVKIIEIFRCLNDVSQTVRDSNSKVQISYTFLAKIFVNPGVCLVRKYQNHCYLRFSSKEKPAW